MTKPTFLGRIIDSMMHKPTRWSRWLHDPASISAIVNSKPDSHLLDVGCCGFRQVKIAQLNGRNDIIHSGVDYSEPESGMPPGFNFRKADLNHEKIPFDDDLFDLVIACHVFEHISNPVSFFGELARVCKPGGCICIETPSERSLWLPGFPFKHEEMYSISFFDDPTHLGRPWSVQSLYRLAAYFGMKPVKIGYDKNLIVRILSPALLLFFYIMKHGQGFQYTVWKTVGWASYLVAQKPIELQGKPAFRYYVPSR